MTLGGSTNGSASHNQASHLSKRLRKGMKGDEVRHLQEVLATDPDIFSKANITGYFGPMTVKAVMQMQKHFGLEPIGQVGPKTITKINSLLDEHNETDEQLSDDTSGDLGDLGESSEANTDSSSSKNTNTESSLKTHTYTEVELLAMAGPTSLAVPLGDNKYSTSGAKKGTVYLCSTPGQNAAGAFAVGSWISGSTWTPSAKVSVAGDVAWSSAVFSASVSGGSRILQGNGLPTTHHTGTFPIASTDPAYLYDRNPNSIKSQTINRSVSVAPTYSDTPGCLTGGAIGTMLDGVSLFNAFDAVGHDAVANEIQDSCGGHPQQEGMYHYHGASACITDNGITQVEGYAQDGFPITGSKVAEGKYLISEDLDECHGITSAVMVDGKSVNTYHYVMTQDFPYSISCFRGKTTQPQSTHAGATGSTAPNMSTSGATTQSGQDGTPPQVALDACKSHTANSSCSFSGKQGETVSGVCNTPPDMSVLACMPTR